jgi:hypothetical protein
VTPFFKTLMNGVSADPVPIASALLGLARVNQWIEHPENAAE